MTLGCNAIISGDPWDVRFFILQCDDIMNRFGRTKDRFSVKALQLHRIYRFISSIEHTTHLQTQDQYLATLQANSMFPEGIEFIRQIPEKRYKDPYGLRWLTGPAEVDDAGDLLGLPTSLLRLIAKTSSAINELRSTASISDESLNDFNARTSVLENEICSWKPAIPHHSCADDEQDARTTMRLALSTAIHHALLIYFYRCVRGVMPMILQHYVESVAQNLETYHEFKLLFYPQGARIGTVVWPSFIASCEAQDTDIRQRLLTCLRYGALSGFKNGEKAEVVVKEVWRRRDAGEANASWRNILEELGAILVLT
ncbi:hypothetical protein QM012_007488 [Aureobasidium pullulans]|uniref:Fungal-specific transcription factor domain-containing protein n=1 Tax=Aureobasidium pullulans TaxID=5580 RepID=A0ABR0TP29_AURPU